MDVREKLLDLIIDAKRTDPETGSFTEYLADHLIANGVTVQEWISVDDRLPQKNGRYLTANKRWDDKINVFDLWFDGGFWYVDGEDDVFDFEVTHWMPMPNPPKGE